ncbi:ABC transporter ATP-binding protein [Pararhodobacter oceanensis]|uniref:ABC transporter ATP-binding protein n=1 Tax=Pararhodobacter oceanensis TaxID=2172121 RepID=A0A2T8HP96_9RHOB|nr:ABC transporter ATP-binding protein [Pararhodobacter oceanensis]PVH27274.1 ABC transporter ATP-binding protein [Pararhodobacter oceanensis]
MIRFHDLSKSYPSYGGRHHVLDRSNAVFEAGVNYALMGHNGAGKSTVMRMVSGADLPTSGWVERQGMVSWPLGFSGGFNSTMTGRENVLFVARTYGQNTAEVLEAAADFAEIGKSMEMPVSTYSTGMKQRLAFGLSLAISFDTYLIDEVTSVGDARFKRKCDEALLGRLATSRVIMISHSETTIRKYCQAGMLLWDRNLYEYDDIEELIKDYKTVCR